MFTVRSLTHVLQNERMSSNVRKTCVLSKICLPERALNVRLKKNNFNAWVAICIHSVIYWASEYPDIILYRYRSMLYSMYYVSDVHSMFFRL